MYRSDKTNKKQEYYYYYYYLKMLLNRIKSELRTLNYE